MRYIFSRIIKRNSVRKKVYVHIFCYRSQTMKTTGLSTKHCSALSEDREFQLAYVGFEGMQLSGNKVPIFSLCAIPFFSECYR